MLVAALAALALGVAAPPAAATTPCARQIIDDWSDADKRITKTYPLPCYQDAIAAVPEDLAAYTGIIDAIAAARQQASRLRRPTSADPSRPFNRAVANDPDRALFKQAFDKLGPRNAEAVPLPLLILASLSLLLIAAGAAGLVSRRLRARKVPG